MYSITTTVLLVLPLQYCTMCYAVSTVGVRTRRDAKVSVQVSVENVSRHLDTLCGGDPEWLHRFSTVVAWLASSSLEQGLALTSSGHQDPEIFVVLLVQYSTVVLASSIHEDRIRSLFRTGMVCGRLVCYDSRLRCFIQFQVYLL